MGRLQWNGGGRIVSVEDEVSPEPFVVNLLVSKN